MSPPTPPANVIGYMQQASAGTGLPISVVEAQNYAESGYGANDGPSSAGALGPWQFEPGTWKALGFPAGKENDWAISTKAYIKYMNQLLKEEGGNIFKALEAYNAGPGNLPAGASYATGILASAGVSQSASAGNPSIDTTTAGITIPNPLSPITGIPSDIVNGLIGGILKAFGVPDFKDLFQRLGLIIFGAILVIVGFHILSSGSNKSSNSGGGGGGGGGGVQLQRKGASKSEGSGLAKGGETASMGDLGATEAVEAAAVA